MSADKDKIVESGIIRTTRILEKKKVQHGNIKVQKGKKQTKTKNKKQKNKKQKTKQKKNKEPEVGNSFVKALFQEAAEAACLHYS